MVVFVSGRSTYICLINVMYVQHYLDCTDLIFKPRKTMVTLTVSVNKALADLST